jgi:phosphohistidine phosphatase SixA
MLSGCMFAQMAAPQAVTATDEIVGFLRGGGHVLVMRHASSPRWSPDNANAHPDNVNRERQLDAVGEATSRAMGEALRELGVPIRETLTSPAFRALQTVRYLGFEDARLAEELGDGGNSMQPGSDAKRSAWLRARVAEPPARGTNTLLVTHSPNLDGAFGDDAAGMEEGEVLIFRPRNGDAVVVGRIKIAEWPALAQH